MESSESNIESIDIALQRMPIQYSLQSFFEANGLDTLPILCGKCALRALYNDKCVLCFKISVAYDGTVNFPVTRKKVEAFLKGDGSSSLLAVLILFPSYEKLSVFAFLRPTLDFLVKLFYIVRQL